MTRTALNKKDLEKQIETEIRKHPECREIQPPRVTGSNQRLYGSNWNISTLGAPELTARVGEVKEIVDDIVRRLQEQFRFLTSARRGSRHARGRRRRLSTRLAPAAARQHPRSLQGAHHAAVGQPALQRSADSSASARGGLRGQRDDPARLRPPHPLPKQTSYQ